MIVKPTRREFLKYAGITALAFGVPTLLPSRALAAWDKGFDFRASSGAETDPADCTYVLAADTYPTTRNSATFGWSTAGGASVDGRDRDIGNDARLEGMIYVGNGIGTGAYITLRVDLPSAGVYDIWLALGDASNVQTIYVVASDNATPFLTFSAVDTTGANSFVDASGAVRTASQWVADSAHGGTKVTQTFASSILNLRMGSGIGGGTNNTTIAALFISQVSGSTPTRHKVNNQ